jgi:cytochrome c oxidase assembly protein subunit 15
MWPATILACAVFAQALLGILTLLLHVPLAAALIHQGGAMIVLALALWNIHARLVIRSPDPGPR